jgi:hypothetical protein
VRIDQFGEGWSGKASEAFWLSRAIEVEVTSSGQHEQAGAVEVAHMIGRYRLQPTMHKHNIPPRFWPIVIMSQCKWGSYEWSSDSGSWGSSGSKACHGCHQ